MGNMNDGMIVTELAPYFEEKYATFAVSSNARALPDVRDGFKPVHRRILYGALGVAPASRATVKSAKIVGDVLANYHPHGDASVYDAMCRMTRNFVNNVSLIEGQGNFGNVDGSGAAAQRYTEARLAAGTDWLVMDGVDAGAVPHSPNYDGRVTEPDLLPVKVPVMLLNGVPGGSIGVGFASQIPPHNAGELADACMATVRALAEGRNPELTEIIRVMPGPDFPTGGLVGGPADVAMAYDFGRGPLRIRGTAEIEDGNGRSGGRIIIDSIPYGVTTEQMVNEIADAAAGKRDAKGVRGEPNIPEIRDVRDETSKDRKTKKVVIRIVVEVKQGESAAVVLEKLYRHTCLETGFSCNFVALNAQGQPVTYPLIELLKEWTYFRSDCIRRHASSKLEVLRDRHHVVSGLLKALPIIDKVIGIIRKAESDDDAVAKLRADFTTKQAEAILAMQLRRLSRMRSDELAKERDQLQADIDGLIDLLTRPEALAEKILADLAEFKKRFARPRQTRITGFTAQDARDLVVAETSLISVSQRGYLRRQPESEFRAQHRGGKGRRGARVKADDVLHSVVTCHSHDRLFAITDGGAVVRLEAHEVPETSSGRHAANLGIEEQERVKSLLTSPWPIPGDAEVVVATRAGEVKRVMLEELSSKMTKRLVFFRSSAEDDIAGGIMLPAGQGDVFLASAYGLGVRFAPTDIRLSKRDSGGVRGMDLRDEDQVVSIGRIESDDQAILCVTSDGIGKRVASFQFPVQGRGGKGRILIKPRPGAYLVEALVVRETDNLLIATEQGMTVRIRVGDAKELGRSAMGVKLLSLNEGDVVVSAAIMPPEEDGEGDE